MLIVFDYEPHLLQVSVSVILAKLFQKLCHFKFTSLCGNPVISHIYIASHIPLFLFHLNIYNVYIFYITHIISICNMYIIFASFHFLHHLLHFFILCVHEWTCVSTVHMCGLQDHLQELVLSYHHMGSGDWKPDYQPCWVP